MRYIEPNDLDREVATSVLANDIWQTPDGEWHEREYWPLPDGYGTSVHTLRAYSQHPEHALELREAIARRCGHLLETPITNPVKLCHEALALDGIARYQPSEEVIALIAASKWHTVRKWEGTINEAWQHQSLRERWPAIYVIYHEDQPLYVGQTAQSIHQRLMQHMHAKTIIGGYLRGMQGMDGARLQVITIATFGHNSLNAAEQYYIDTLKPTYNQQRAMP